MTIAKKIEIMLSKSSWIRKMFEEGARLKAKHGADGVYDFSLGNPNLQPPEEFRKVLIHTVNASGTGDHAYMPNTGYPHVRKAVADYLSAEQQTNISANDIIMTCGAAGALNVILKAILDPGDEIITPAPYFVEYNFYSDNHGGVLKTAPTKATWKRASQGGLWWDRYPDRTLTLILAAGQLQLSRRFLERKKYRFAKPKPAGILVAG